MKKLLAKPRRFLSSESSLSNLHTSIFRFENIDTETDTDLSLIFDNFKAVCEYARHTEHKMLSSNDIQILSEFLGQDPRNYPKMNIEDIHQFLNNLRLALQLLASPEERTDFDKCQALYEENQALRSILQTLPIENSSPSEDEAAEQPLFETSPEKIKQQLHEHKLTANNYQISEFSENAKTYAELGLLLQELESAHEVPSKKSIQYLKLKYLAPESHLSVRSDSKDKHINKLSPKAVRRSIAATESDTEKLNLRINDLIKQLVKQKDRPRRLESLRELYADLKLLGRPAKDVQIKNLEKLRAQYKEKLLDPHFEKKKIALFTHLIDIELEIFYISEPSEFETIKTELLLHVQERHNLYLKKIHAHEHSLSFENLDRQDIEELSYTLELMQAKALIGFKEAHYVSEDEALLGEDTLMQFRSTVLTFFEEAFIFNSTQAKTELQKESATDDIETLQKLSTKAQRTKRISTMIKLSEALERKGLYSISILLTTILSNYEGLFKETFGDLPSKEKQIFTRQKAVLEQDLTSFSGYKNKIAADAILYPHRPIITVLDPILKTNVMLRAQDKHKTIVGICAHMRIFRNEFTHALKAKQISELLTLDQLDQSILELVLKDCGENPYEDKDGSQKLVTLSGLLRPRGKQETQ